MIITVRSSYCCFSNYEADCAAACGASRLRPSLKEDCWSYLHHSFGTTSSYRTSTFTEYLRFCLQGLKYGNQLSYIQAVPTFTLQILRERTYRRWRLSFSAVSLQMWIHQYMDMFSINTQTETKLNVLSQKIQLNSFQWCYQRIIKC